MTSARFVRGSNSRMLAYLSGLLLFTAIIFLYHNARVEVDTEKEALVKCQQAQESLSAQLQVIFEYKVRLEKNLNEERNRHQETKDKLHAYLSNEQEKDKETQEAINKFSALQQQYKLLRTQNEDLHAEGEKDRTTCKSQYKALEQKSTADQEKLRARLKQVQEESDDYHKQLVELQNLIKKTDGQSDVHLKENIRLKKGNENLREQIEKLQKRLKGVASSTDRGGAAVGPSGERGGAQGGSDVGALAAPNHGHRHSPSSSTPTPDGRQGMNDVIANQLAASNSKALGKQSTTPQINPEALLSQEKAGAGVGAHGGVAAPPVAPAPPSLGSSQGPKHFAAIPKILKSKEIFQEAQQQQVAVLPVPMDFRENIHAGMVPVPAVVPALAPPQQNILHPPQSLEVPSNQGQQPPLEEGGFDNGFNAPIPIQRNFGAQRENENWIAAFNRPLANQRRKPVAAPVEARGREDRQRVEWERQQAPFPDYEKDVHAGENEEDDDDDADQMDNAVNQAVRAPDSKPFGVNKFSGRNNLIANPR